MASNPPAGWYPDPSGSAGQRYFNGEHWTDHYHRPQQQQPSITINTTNTVGQGPAVVVSQGPNHALHLVLTLLTCGLWLPVWLIVSISSGRTVTVGSGNAQTGLPGGGRGWLIAGAVFVGLVLFGVVAEHPIALVPIAAIGAIGYLGYREYQQAVARRRADAGLAMRADAENAAMRNGDPRGLYGQYPPAFPSTELPPPPPLFPPPPPGP